MTARAWVPRRLGLALIVRLGPFAFEMVSGEAAASPTGLHLDAAPYSERGPYRVGTRNLVIDREASLAGTFWYPASGDDEARTT